MVEDTILKRVKKLLALSNKNSNENEAAAAAAKAQELLLSYNLSMAQVESTEFEKREQVSHVYREIFRQNRINWKIDLANTVAKANLCNLLTSGRRLIWIGKPSNIEVAEFLWATLCDDLEIICDKRWNDIIRLREMEKQTGINLFTSYSLRYVHGKTWKNSFYYGAIDTIGQRLNESKKNMSTDPNMSALIVLSDKEIENYVGRVWPKLGKSNINFNLYGSAYESGRAAGKSIQFKQGMGAGGTHGNNNLLNRG
jgi:hypothetical protein